MRAYYKLAGLGLACMLIFAIGMFPAHVAFSLFAPDGVYAFGVKGTAWQGSARIISVNGQQFRNTEWDLSVTRLLIGQLGGDFATRWGDGFVEGTGRVGLTGTINLGATRGSFNAASLEQLLGIPRVGGQVSMDIEELELKDNWPYRLIGNGEIRNFSSPLMGTGSADIIGNVALKFDTATETEGETITGKLTDLGGPLELNGTLLLKPPSDYTLKARIKARPEAPEALKKNLEFLGSPEADGTRIFQLAGSI